MFILEADERVMLAMARIDEKVGLSTKNRASQDHPPLKMKLPSRVERKCGEWCEVQSKTKKKIYYLNIRTKETTWKKPPGWCDKTVSQFLCLSKYFFGVICDLPSATCLRKNRLRDRFSGSKYRQVTRQGFSGPKTVF